MFIPNKMARLQAKVGEIGLTLTSKQTSATNEDLDTTDIKAYEQLLENLETEWMIERRSVFHRFFDLPAELRVRVYEFAASNCTIEIQYSIQKTQWPSLLLTTRQLQEEAVISIFRYAAFVASAPYLDFFTIIRFMRDLPPLYLKTLTSNGRLFIYFSAQSSPFDSYVAKVHYLEAWLARCRESAQTGRYINWHYIPKHFTSSIYWLPIIPFQWQLNLDFSGYSSLRDLYDMLELDPYERYELRKILVVMWNYIRPQEMVR